MTHHTVEMKGNWTRAWPNQAISLLDCVFQGDESVLQLVPLIDYLDLPRKLQAKEFLT